ncbi:DUF4440 domain-containing protein [Actinomadura sp. B10D3]|uniref:DUF4440 domain-containing protein n=1 Tax=Actinomadura sp. B10D3 TaxID=3153557 RepID=UPI00325E125B
MLIGFAGLGQMGKPMASHLARTGHTVLAYDSRLDHAPEGLTAASSPAELADASLSISISALARPDLAYTHSNADVDTLESYRDKVRSGFYVYHRIDHPVDRIVVSGDTAVVLGEMHADITAGGTRKRLANRSLAVWVRESDRWLLLAYQPTVLHRTDRGPGVGGSRLGPRRRRRRLAVRPRPLAGAGSGRPLGSCAARDAPVGVSAGAIAARLLVTSPAGTVAAPRASPPRRVRRPRGTPPPGPHPR